MKTRIAAMLAAALLWSAQAAASPIFYEVQSLGGDQWRYSYTVGNGTGAPIESFRIYFQFGLFEFQLTEVELFPGFFAEEVDPDSYSGPAGWEVFVAPPDSILGVNENGFFDALAEVNALAPDELLGGFSIDFQFLGANSPGSQFFELLDALGTTVLGSGFTQPMTAIDVPEPGTLGLLAAGLLFGWRRRATRAMTSAVT